MTEQAKMILDKRDAKIEQLTRQKERLKKQVANQKKRIAKLETANKKLQKILIDGGLMKEPPVKRLQREHPMLASVFQQLCRSWNLKTLNYRNTAMAILRLIEPDENGVVEHTEEDLVRFINGLIKLGKVRYLSIPELNQWYYPHDSLTIFKNYPRIRKILLEKTNPEQYKQEALSLITKPATANGEPMPNVVTVTCSEEDLLSQKRDQEHPNDNVDLGKFKGDDLIRERARRQAKITGKVDMESVKQRMEYLAEQVFTSRQNEQQSILKKASIKVVKKKG